MVASEEAPAVETYRVRVSADLGSHGKDEKHYPKCHEKDPARKPFATVPVIARSGNT